MIRYSRYINQEDHVWYDSSNLLYSKCYDTNDLNTKTLKIVFKGGRTYLYKNVDVQDYMLLKTSPSNGDAFNKHIKKYEGVRITDTDVEKLTQLEESFKKETEENDERKIGDTTYLIKIDENTNEFVIILNDKVLFRGIEGKFSILNLFSSLNIKYVMESVQEGIPNDSDEEKDLIKI